MKNFKQYSQEEKEQIIEEASKHYYNFMKTLGLNPDFELNIWHEAELCTELLKK